MLPPWDQFRYLNWANIESKSKVVVFNSPYVADSNSDSSVRQRVLMCCPLPLPRSSAAPPPYLPVGNMVPVGSMAPAQPQGTVAFAPHPSMLSVAPPAAAAPHNNNEEDDDEDYDS